MPDTRKITGLDGRQLPGFLKKSFVLNFAGGEIWFEHLDGIYEHEALVLEKLNADSRRFLRPSSPAFVGFVLDETTLTPAISDRIVQLLTESGKRFMRVAFIGVGRREWRTLRRDLIGKGFAIEAFYDFEAAKEWLVAEGV